MSFLFEPETIQRLLIKIGLLGVQPICVEDICPSGSRVICNPPPVGSDEDYFVLAGGPVSYETLEAALIAAGYTKTENEYPPDHFESFRKGDLNVMLMKDAVAFQRVCVATELAKRFNLLDKQDRIDLFNAIEYGTLNP